MGKSISKSNPYVLSDEVLNTLPSSAASKTAQVKADNAAKNPYILSSDVLSTIPEKKKTLDTGLIESSPSESESESALKENATDFLLQDIDNNDFFSRLAKQTDRYFPQTTPGRVNQQAAEMTKQEVFRNPGSLQRYADERVKKIQDEISNLKQDLRETLTSHVSEFTPSLSLPELKKEYSKKKAQVLEKQNYLNQLKSSVAEVAADAILSQQDLTSFNPRTIGREIIKIADSEQEQLFKMAEKNGQTLPGIRQAELERVGLNAVKGFVLKNTELPNRDNIIRQINEYERDYDTRNFEATGQRVREKIGAQLYKEGKSGFFGFGYKASTLQEAANNPATGLTDSERKVFEEYVLPLERKIIGTDIPTSGFTRGFYNAIEKGAIGMGKTMEDVTGLRGEAEQAQDILNREVDMSRYRPAGENPNAAAQLSFLQEKEKKGALSDSEKTLKKELENYTYVRNGWSKFKDGVGDLTGQVALIALTTKGIGATGQALKISGTSGGLLGGMTRGTLGAALSNETVGLFVSSYLNSYDNYKQQAIQLMPGDDKAANRNAYATTMASIEALSERIFRDTKILDAFTTGAAPAIRDITNKLINREIAQQVARQETQNAITAALKPFAKEYAKATFQESTEEAVVDFAQGAADAVFGGEDFDIVKTGQQALNTFLTTALYSPIVSGMAAAGAARRNRSQNAFIKSAIVDMAANPAAYLKSVEDLQVEGAINQQQANEKIQLIKSANQYLQEVPVSRKIVTKVGEGETATTVEQEKSFDYPETSAYLLHRLNEGILTEQINNTTDEILKARLQKDLKRSQEIRKGLFDGSIGVTTDLQDVSGDPEKAAELGIANADELTADVLIGTPFERETEQKVPRETQKQADEKESESQAAEVAPAEDQAAPTEGTQSQAPQIDIPEIRDLVAKNIDNVAGTQKTLLQEASDEDLVDVFKFMAEQAQDENSANQARETFGDELVNYANQLFPVQKIKTNENEISQEGSAQEDGEEINIQESDEADAAEDADVLTEQPPEFSASSKKHFEYVPIEEIEQYREFDREVVKKNDLDKLTEDIRKNGIKEPIQLKVDRNGNALIVEGNTRLAAAKRAGIKNIPVEVVEGEFGSINKEKINPLPKIAASEKLRRSRDLPLREKEGAFSRGFSKVTPTGTEKSITQKGKELADRIRSLKTRRDIAQANIFGIAIGIYDGAIETIATAVEQGAKLADAINQGIQYIRDSGGAELDEANFRKHIEDQASGVKPKIKVQVGEEETETKKEPPNPPKPPKTEQEEPEVQSIENYRMTTSGEVGRFMSGDTWEDVFGEAPEGSQNYRVQALTDMLQDGKNMIAIAQQRWGADEMMYGRPLFQFIQGMSNDAQLTNKKAVLLATLLGELQEAKLRSPERFDAISQLEKAVFAYYQNYMNLRGKEIVAGRLLRLYRDKYVGDIYADQILEKEQVKAKKKVQEAEQKKDIDDSTAQQAAQTITKEEKAKEDKAAKEKSKKAKKDQGKKKKLSSDEAKQMANQKLSDIENKLGSEAKKGLIARIQEAINKLNCK